MGCDQGVPARRAPLRPTIRVRLTLLLLGLVVVAGMVLLALTHVLLTHALTGGLLGPPPPRGARVGLPGRPGPPPPLPRLPTTPGALLRFRQSVEAAALHALTVQSGLALGVMAVFSALAGWLVAGRLLRPLRGITATARRLSQETLDARIRMGGPQDEIKDLADTFDEMLGRLETASAIQRRFLANVSHELRTPLTLQRTVIDVALADTDASAPELREALEEVSGAVAQQQHLVEGLLLLAISERGLERARPVGLDGVVEQAVARATRLAPGAGIAIRSTVRPARVDGDPVLLERMFANLLENGVRYNVPDGSVEVAMELAEDSVRTAVRNTGPVVPPDRIAALFEPFRRLDADRTADGGAGLGLSIVQAIALAHRGAVRATARAGGGLDVVVELPLTGRGDPSSRAVNGTAPGP